MRKYITILLLTFSGSAFAEFLDCPCVVVKVIDGDTVHVLDKQNNRHKIRLAGIDAPERKQAFGNKSTQNLASYIAGEFVRVEYYKFNRYGRVLGKVIRQRQDINLIQLKDGFAWHYKQYQDEQSKQDQAFYIVRLKSKRER